MSNFKVPAAFVVPALIAGGLSLWATLGASPAEARDNCKRLPSASLVILIPDGGCDVTDPDKQPKVPGDVTVIRGGVRTVGIDRTTTGSITRSASPGGPLVIVIKDL